MSDGRLRAGITNASSIRKAVNSAPNKVLSNQWNHLVMTHDGSKIKGFVNGVLVASVSQTGDIQSTSYPLIIGKALPDAYILHGLIDEFNMYNIALSDADVLTKYKLYNP